MPIMNYNQIENNVKNVRDALKKGRFDDALKSLEKFIQQTEDNELDKSFVSLSARHNLEKKERNLGMKDSEENQNKIIYAITQLLIETKEFAIEKATFRTGLELEKLNQRGNEAIGILLELTKLMADSRLLEIEMFQDNFGAVFSKEQNQRMKTHHEQLKKILSNNNFIL
jgi:hypothetical protein